MNLSPANIVVAPMTIAHVADALALWKATEGLILTDSDNVDDLAVYFRRNPKLSHVALAGDRVIGAVLCGHDGRRGYLHHLAVAHEYRGQSIGRSLVNACLTKLTNDGIGQCNIFVIDDHDAGRAFWQADDWHEWPTIRLMSKKLTT